MTGPPVLWHFPISHFNEKARWALDWKGIPHIRRAVPPGPHAQQMLELSGQRAVPVLELDGKVIPDSTAIIAALESASPTPALYPRDAGERTRTLALEELFDEELGPHTRRLAWPREPGGWGARGGVSFTDVASETPTKSTTATLVAYETTCIEPETMIVGVADKVALVVMSAKAGITRPGRRASLSPAHPIGGEHDTAPPTTGATARSRRRKVGSAWRDSPSARRARARAPADLLANLRVHATEHVQRR